MRPNVFDYLDWHRFLEDWYRWQRKRRPGFTHAQWARKAKISAPGLHYVLVKRRLPTPITAAAVVASTDLEEDEARFLMQLFELAASPTWDDRSRRLERVLADPSFRGSITLHGPELRYLSRWYIVAIREMAAFPDFCADPRWIQERLIAPVPIEGIEAALATLIELGLLIRHPDGAVRPTALQATTTVDPEGADIYAHHRAALEIAARGLDVIPSGERAYIVGTIGLPAGKIDALRNELHAFAQRIGAEADAAEGEGRRVYQVSIQVLPLTKAP